jgi:hypothetical protein
MKNFLKYSVVILFFGWALTSGYSCTEEEPTMTKETKELADSLFGMRKELLVKEIDSLCNVTYQERFNKAVDSVSEVRIREIDRLLGNQ